MAEKASAAVREGRLVIEPASFVNVWFEWLNNIRLLTIPYKSFRFQKVIQNSFLGLLFFKYNFDNSKICMALILSLNTCTLHVHCFNMPLVQSHIIVLNFFLIFVYSSHILFLLSSHYFYLTGLLKL